MRTVAMNKRGCLCNEVNSESTFVLSLVASIITLSKKTFAILIALVNFQQHQSNVSTDRRIRPATQTMHFSWIWLALVAGLLEIHPPPIACLANLASMDPKLVVNKKSGISIF